MAQKVEAAPSKGFAEADPGHANPWKIAQQQFDIAANVLGLDPNPTTPEQMLAYMKSEMAKWGEVIRAANVKAD